ncbi:MAG: polymer-forming cytoskeletal protein [Bacteroidales bacterium]|nr:polymer-forming cytoskeletal protein [Bacteroidales bacterium]
MGRNQAEEQSIQNINILSNGTIVIGDIKVEGDIRIDGNVNGKIHVKGKIIIGSTAHIEGEIVCHHADIGGVIKGKLHVHELIMLRNTARIYGDIQTQKISIEPGAIFNGSCIMSSDTPSSKSH